MFGTLISSVTVGAGGAASITFSSIPATYTDLTLVLSLRDTTTWAFTQISFNGVGGSSYTVRTLEGSGAAVTSRTSASTSAFDYPPIDKSSYTANTFSNVVVTIPNYAGSTNKTVSFDGVSENNATEAYAILGAGLFANTSAISSISIGHGSTFAQYSTAYLYGTLKGSGGATVA